MNHLTRKIGFRYKWVPDTYKENAPNNRVLWIYYNYSYEQAGYIVYE